MELQAWDIEGGGGGGNWEDEVYHGEINTLPEGTQKKNSWSFATFSVGLKDQWTDYGNERSNATSSTYQHKQFMPACMEGFIKSYSVKFNLTQIFFDSLKNNTVEQFL